jgi:hypothetical protein
MLTFNITLNRCSDTLLGIKLLKVALLALLVVGWGVNMYAASRAKTENAQKTCPPIFPRDSRLST